MKTATIIWDEGQLICTFDDGTRVNATSENPITAASDSHGIAALFGRWDSVDHDSDTIHVARQD